MRHLTVGNCGSARGPRPRIVAWATPNVAERDGRVWEFIVLTLTEDPENVGLDDYLDRFETLNDTHWVWHDPSL